MGCCSWCNELSQAGGEFQVNTYTSDTQWLPEVAMNDDGRFVAVWESNGQDGDGYGIFAETGFIPEPATLGLLLAGLFLLLKRGR